MSRGLRNNNPGNIRLSKVNYLGETSSNDTSFKTFKSMAWGYRAMFVVLDSYHRRGLTSIAKMINRYAPPVENHTDNYIDFVARGAKIDKDESLDIKNKSQMMPIVMAMSYMENGTPALEGEVCEGWDLFMKFLP